MEESKNDIVYEKKKVIGKKTRRKATSRFLWPDEIHRLFVAAIFDIGLSTATPKTIMEIMGKSEKTPPMTLERLKSHLQKYRAYYDRSRDQFFKYFNEGAAALECLQPFQYEEESLERSMPLFPVMVNLSTHIPSRMKSERTKQQQTTSITAKPSYYEPIQEKSYNPSIQETLPQCEACASLEHGVHGASMMNKQNLQRHTCFGSDSFQHAILECSTTDELTQRFPSESLYPHRYNPTGCRSKRSMHYSHHPPYGSYETTCHHGIRHSASESNLSYIADTHPPTILPFGYSPTNGTYHPMLYSSQQLQRSYPSEDSISVTPIAESLDRRLTLDSPHHKPNHHTTRPYPTTTTTTRQQSSTQRSKMEQMKMEQMKMEQMKMEHSIKMEHPFDETSKYMEDEVTQDSSVHSNVDNVDFLFDVSTWGHELGGWPIDQENLLL